MNQVAIPVGEVSEQIRGVSYGKGDATDAPEDGYLPVLRAGNITEFGVIYDDLVYVPRRFVSEKQLLRSGDVLIAASSGSLDVVGKAAPVLSDYEGAFGAFCKVLRPIRNRVDPRYFSHYFRTTDYRRTVSNLAAGANINNLKNEHLDNLLIPLPTIDEQRRIAAILDQADALRAKRRDALAQLDRLAQSVFVEMFGDPETNPKNLRKSAISDIAEVSTGSTPSRGSGDFYGGSIPWVKTTEVTGEVIHDTEEKLTEAGLRSIRGKLHPVNSILVAMYGQGQTRGRAALLAMEASCNQACGVIRPSEHYLPRFMLAQLLLGYDRLRALGRGGNQENLNLQLLGAFEVLVPPLAIQQAFVTRMSAIDALKAMHRTALAELDALFASLQHRAFRGEL